MPKKIWYNTDIVQREHRHLCSLRNKCARAYYTDIVSTKAKEVTIKMVGIKSGTIYESSDAMGNVRMSHEYNASHLLIGVYIAKRLLEEDVDNYASSN